MSLLRRAAGEHKMQVENYRGSLGKNAFNNSLGSITRIVLSAVIDSHGLLLFVYRD